MNKGNNIGVGGDCTTGGSNPSSPLQPPPLLLLSAKITMTDDARYSDSVVVVQTSDISTNVVISKDDHFSSSAEQTTKHSTGGNTDLSNSVTQWYQRSEPVSCTNAGQIGNVDDICQRDCGSHDRRPTDDIMLNKYCYQANAIAVDISRTVRDTDVESSGKSVNKSCNSSPRDDCRSTDSIETNADKTIRISRNMCAQSANVQNSRDTDTKQSYYSPITSSECNNIVMDPDESLLNSGSNFGESHVNKLMSFVDSLDRHELPLKKSPDYSAIKSVIGKITTEKHPERSMKVSRGESLYKPYERSPSSRVSSIRTNNCHSSTPESELLEEPLDLSFNREDLKNEFSDKFKSGLTNDDFQTSLDRFKLVAQNSNESSKFDEGINKKDSISRPIARPWRFDVEARPENIDWSQTSSSLSSLHAQMEAVVMSYPIFRASMQYCKDMFTPVCTENVKPDVSGSKSNRDAKISTYDSALSLPPSKRIEHTDDPVRRSNGNNQKQQKYLHKFNHSPRIVRKSKVFEVHRKRWDKQSPISGNLSPLRISSAHHDFGKPDYDNNRETFTKSGRDISGKDDSFDTRRPLTSLSCSCRRQFSTLYQLTIHMKKTGHGPSTTAADLIEDFPKLVRGQDLWMSLGHAQKERTLSCMRCHASFQTLPELTVHMVKTKHYVDIVGHENCEPTQKLLNGEPAQKLFDSEILLKLEKALKDERSRSKMFAEKRNVCKQCLSPFSDADALSEHLFVTGHQMLFNNSKEALCSPSGRSYFTDESCETRKYTPDECNSADSKHIWDNYADRSQGKNSLKHIPNRTQPNLLPITKRNVNRSPESVIFKKQNQGEKVSKRYNVLSSDKSVSSDFVKLDRSSDTEFDRNVMMRGNANLDNSFMTVNNELQTSTLLLPNEGMNQKPQSKNDPETRKCKKGRLEHSERTLIPFTTCSSPSDDNKSWNNDAVNQTTLIQSEHGLKNSNQSEKIEETVTNNFTEFICPSAGVVDSSSTLKAMESFVERSFSFTNYFATINDTPALQLNPQDTQISGTNLSTPNVNLLSHGTHLSAHSAHLSSRSAHSKEVDKHGGRTQKTISINTTTMKKTHRLLSKTANKLSTLNFEKSSSGHSPAAQRQATKRHKLMEVTEQQRFKNEEDKCETNDNCISQSNSSTVVEVISSVEDNRHKKNTISNVLLSSTKPDDNSYNHANSSTSQTNKSERINVTDSKPSVQKSYTSSTLQYIQLLVDDTISNTSQTQFEEDGSVKMNVPDVVGKVGITT